MALKRFAQFLEEKKAGKNGGDPAPKVKMAIVPDYDGKKSDTPPGGGKSYGTGKGVGKGFSEGPKGESKGESLADKGDKSLKYNPATPYKHSTDLKPIKGERKVKCENFIDATKDMNPSDFAAYMIKKNANLGSIHEAASKFSALVKDSPSGVMTLVGEARRNGFFRILMAEMLQYPEAMQVIAKLLGDKNEGAAAARRLVNAMNEMVGPPMHQTLGKGPKPKPPLAGSGPDDDMDDDGMGGPDDDDMGDGHAPPDDMGGSDDDMGDDDDMGGPDDDMGDDDDMGGSDDDMGDDHASPNDMGDDDDMGGSDDDMGGSPDDVDNDSGEDMPELKPHNGKKPPFTLKTPRPSMMHRMMRPESTSPAVQNFMRALQG